MSKGSGCGQTPEKVRTLIQDAIKAHGLRDVSTGLGLGIGAVHRYSKGVGEPTAPTLEKISAYFGVPVPTLRGGAEAEQFLAVDRIAQKARELKEMVEAGIDSRDPRFLAIVEELSALGQR